MSSAGQDQWIREQFPKGYAGWGFDIGAADGMFASNTYSLEAEGWNILCVEAMHVYASRLRQSRRRSILAAVDGHAQEWGEFSVNASNPTAHSSLRPTKPLSGPDTVVRVPVLTLNQLLFMSGFPRLDLVSIDIEGTELDALKGLDIARWQPKVIMVECWPGTDAADRMDAYLAPFGYKPGVTLEHDRGYIHERDAGRPDRQAEHREPENLAPAGEGVSLQRDDQRGVRRRPKR